MPLDKIKIFPAPYNLCESTWYGNFKELCTFEKMNSVNKNVRVCKGRRLFMKRWGTVFIMKFPGSSVD